VTYVCPYPDCGATFDDERKFKAHVAAHIRGRAAIDERAACAKRAADYRTRRRFEQEALAFRRLTRRLMQAEECT
jgi:hypothetical protein